MTVETREPAIEDVCCLAPHPAGYVCTEPRGHDGWHRAEGTYNRLCETWPPTYPRRKKGRSRAR